MIYILGAGAMGCLWAARLQEKANVRFLSTLGYAQKKGFIGDTLSRHAELPQREFLLQHTTEATHADQQIQVSISQQLPPCKLERDSLLLVTTKSYDALDALREWLPQLDTSHRIILFQNGMGSQEKVVNELQSIPCFAAVSTEAANLRDKNHLIHAAKGHTFIGPLNEAASTLSQDQVSGLMQALQDSDLSLEFYPDIYEKLWRKLIINCAINPFTAISNCLNGEVKELPLFQKHWQELLDELGSLSRLSGYPLSETEIENLVFSVIESTAQNRSSMLQDKLFERKTEIDDINGFAAGYLNKHDCSGKINRLLTDMVHALRN